MKKLLLLAVFTICYLVTTHAYAFGGLLEKLNDAIVEKVVGAANPEIKSEPLNNRFNQVADVSKLKVTGSDEPILGSKSYKLAIVKSVNVETQLNSDKKFTDDWRKRILKYVDKPHQYLDDYDASIPGHVLVDRAEQSLKAKFKEAIYVKSVDEGLKQGADYVALIDIKVEFKQLSSKFRAEPLRNKYVNDLSTIFINKSYEVGPDIVITNTFETPNGLTEKNDALLRSSLDEYKMARQKTFDEFEAKLNKLVISELDDPPVIGIKLSLGGEANPKKKSKKKN